METSSRVESRASQLFRAKNAIWFAGEDAKGCKLARRFNAKVKQTFSITLASYSKRAAPRTPTAARAEPAIAVGLAPAPSLPEALPEVVAEASIEAAATRIP